MKSAISIRRSATGAGGADRGRMQYPTGGLGLFGDLRVEAGHEHLRKLHVFNRLSKHPGDVPQAEPAKYDNKLTFDKVSDVYRSGTEHDEDQPPHLKVLDFDVCVRRCTQEYGNPCQYFCPAAVYEIEEAKWRAQAQDQLLELRTLQDVRHHGPVPDH